MKPSGIEWIGDIPDDWEVTKIGQLYLERNEKVSDREYEALSVTKHGILKQLESAAKTDNGDNRKLVKSGDFVINSRSDRRGSCGISKFDGSVSLINIILMPTQKIANGYYNYLFRTENFADEFYKYGNGIVDDLWSTKWTSMKKILVPFPSLRTQQRIADYLDEKCGEIDATIAKQKESIEKLKAYKQSLISETVTKGLDKSAPLKPSGIDYLGDIPSHWEIRKLKYVANFNQNTLPEDTDGQFELKYIDIGNVSSVDGIKEIQYFNFSNAPSRARRIVKYGDIIVSTVRTYLRAITSIKEDYDNCICSTGFAVITPKDNFQQDFVVYAIENESFIAQIIANSQGISYPAINVSQLENLKLAFPSVKEQKEIVDFLKTKLLEIDSIINKKQNIIQKLDTYKKSLIFEYVTGKKYV